MNVIFETTKVTFSFNFNAMKDHSSVYNFLAETLYDFYKTAHQSAKFQTFDCSGEISPNLYFDKAFLW